MDILIIRISFLISFTKSIFIKNAKWSGMALPLCDSIAGSVKNLIDWSGKFHSEIKCC